MQRVRLNMVSSTFKVVIALMLALIPLLSVVPASAESEFPELVSKSVIGEESDQGVGDSGGYEHEWMSNDGRYVAYTSQSNNLGGQRPDTRAIYVYDRVAQTTVLASVDSNGEQENGLLRPSFALSGDGRHVVFATDATNLDPNAKGRRSVYVHDLNSGVTSTASIDSNGQRIYNVDSFTISHDGSTVAFNISSTGNNTYIRDITNSSTEELSLHTERPIISGDDSKLLYTSSTTPSQAMVYDRTSGTSTMASVGPDGSPADAHVNKHAHISADGGYVLFKSSATNLTPGGPPACSGCGASNLYRRDTVNGVTERVDTSAIAASGVHVSNMTISSLSADGSIAAFEYIDNGNFQVAIHNFNSGITRVVGLNSEEEVADSYVVGPAINSDGTLVAFTTNAPNFGVTNRQAFVTSTGVNPDTTNPTIDYSLSTPPNANGWNNSDVTVTFTCDDADSGIASCPDSVVVSTEGTDQVISGTAVDNAGNEASTEVLISLDKTAPDLTYTLDPAANAAGWHNSDVTVTFNCTDSLSGVDTCTNPSTITAEGANHQVPGSATDLAGNTADTTATVNLDKTAPTITTPTMSGLLFGFLHLGQTTDISADVADNLSGVVQAEYYFNTDPGEGNGTAMDLNGSTATATANAASLGGGQHTLYVRSQDTAGNWSTVAERSFLRLF